MNCSGTSVLVTLLVLTACRKLHGPGAIPPHPGDGIWHAAGCRARLPARTWPLVNCSWAAPACAHSSTAWQGWRINDDAAKSFPEVKAKKQQCWHPSGAWVTSRGHQLTGDHTVMCSWARGACRAPGHCQDHYSDSTPGPGSSLHHTEM